VVTETETPDSPPTFAEVRDKGLRLSQHGHDLGPFVGANELVPGRASVTSSITIQASAHPRRAV
jgi:hypothetical protein